MLLPLVQVVICNTKMKLCEVAFPSAEKRQLAVEIFGSNITLNGKSLAGRALKPWDALLSSHSKTSMVHISDAVRTAFGLPSETGPACEPKE